jgi:translation initiation factor IF-2
MAITCPRCGAGFDVTLFQFGHGVCCGCGAWVWLETGHVVWGAARRKERATMAEEEIGRISHYFSKAGVAAIEITQGSLAVGDTIHVKGHTSDFTQKVDSMQIEHQPVQKAVPGQSIGIKVAQHAREHDVVYKVTPES